MMVEMNPVRVRSLREEKGMNRGDLAAAAGVSLKTASRAERGEPVLLDGQDVGRGLG